MKMITLLIMAIAGMVLLTSCATQVITREDFTMEYQNDKLKISFVDKDGVTHWGKFNFTINHVNGNDYLPSQIKQIAPLINFSQEFINTRNGVKWNIHIDTPDAYIGKYNLTVCADSLSNDLSWNDFRRQGSTLTFKKKMKIDFGIIKRTNQMTMISNKCVQISGFDQSKNTIDPLIGGIENDTDTIAMLISTSVTGVESERQRGGSWAGYIISTRGDCDGIGRLEKDIKRMVCVETYSYLYDEYFTAPSINETTETIEQGREFYVPLSLIFNETELDTLHSIEYNQDTETYNESIRSLYLNDASNLSSGYKTRLIENVTDIITFLEWDDKENASALHGSGGDYTCCGALDDYQDLSTWESTEDADLNVTGLNSTLHINNKGTAVSSSMIVDGWTTSKISMPRIYCHICNRGAKWDWNGFYMNLSSAEATWIESFGEIDNLAIYTNYRRVFKYVTLAEGNLTVRDSFFYIDNTYSAGSVEQSGTVGQMNVYNNVIFGTSLTGYGIIGDNGGLLYAYHNTMVNRGSCGITSADGHGVFKNNLVYNCTTDWSLGGVGQGDYNTIYDVSAASHFVHEWDLYDNVSSDIFVDAPNLDFTLVANSELIDKGFNIATDGNLTFYRDIEKDVRPSGTGWDLGADENETVTWLDDWAYRIPVVVDKDKIDSNLDHFPLLIVFDSAQADLFTELGNGFKKMIITREDGRTPLFAEVEGWNSTAQTGYVWVSKRDWRIKHYENTTIYVYFDSVKDDNNTIGTNSDGSVATHGVWDENYRLVLHMNGSAGGSIDDSTLNNNDITATTGSPVYMKDSVVGKAVNYTNAYNSIPDSTAWDFGGHEVFTIEFITHITKVPTGFIQFITHGDPAGGTDNMWSVRKDNGVNTLQFYENTAGTTQHQPSASKTYDTANWDYLAVTHLQDDLFVFYNDDTILGSSTDAGSIGGHVGTLEIGGTVIATNRNMNGTLDEIRISHVARSDTWINATYKTIFNQLLTLKAIEALAGEEPAAGGLNCTYEGQTYKEFPCNCTITSPINAPNAILSIVPSEPNEFTVGADITADMIIIDADCKIVEIPDDGNVMTVT